MARLENFAFIKQSGCGVDDLKSQRSTQWKLVGMAYLLWTIVPAHRDVMRPVTFGRHEGLKDLSDDRPGRVVRINEMNIVT